MFFLGMDINPILVMMVVPILSGIILLLFRNKRLNSIVLVLDSVVYLWMCLLLLEHPVSLTPYLQADSLSLLFMLVLGVVYLGCSCYNLKATDKSEASNLWHTLYTVSFLAFMVSMNGVALSTHAALLWVFVEATTLTSAPLIYFSQTKSSLEATWKYIFICSIGIAMAFVGILLFSLGLGETQSLFFNDLYTNVGLINPLWLRLAFPFILIGFGTKTGLAPVHAWLPDAHSEAPPVVSAMLSGTLLNMAFLGVLRFYKIMVLANEGAFAGTLLIIMGFASMFVSAVYILRVRNYKRMLAYSSIENLGIAAIGIGMGGIGIFAAFLHLVAHSLAKSSFFLTSGNILRLYKDKKIENVKGLSQRDALTGWLWVGCFIAIMGLPPFPAFISEFYILRAFLQSTTWYLAIVFFFLLTLIFYGMGRSVIGMVMGKDTKKESSTARLRIVNYLPQIIFLGTLIVIGSVMPKQIYILLQNAVAVLQAGTP